MRTGAIFARGSCQALKWMALFGVVFALGTGSAAAQVTVKGPAMNKVVEGASATYTVAVKGYAAAGAAEGTVTVTLAAPTGAAGNDATAGENGDFSTNLTGLTYTATVPANSGTAPKAFSSSGSIVLQTTHDPDAEDENFTLAFSADAVGGLVVSAEDGAAAITLADGSPTALIIDDDETQTYVLELAAGQTLTEGDAARVTLKAVPDHVDASLALTLHSSDAVNYVWDDDDFSDGTVDAPATIAVGPTGATVPGPGVGNSTSVYVKAPDNDKNRDTNTVTLTAYSGSAGSATMQASVDISFADDHVLAPAEAVTAVAMDKKSGDDAMEVMSVTEGGDPVYLTISVDRGKAADKDATTLEKLTVDVKVAPANAADASVTPTRVELDAVTTANGKQSATVKVELSALADEDVGDETLMLQLEMMGQAANGSGSSTGMFEIAITDDTDKKIWPKAESDAYPKIQTAIEEGGGDDGLNPGDSFMVMTDDLFGVADGYTASYSVSVEGGQVSASSSGESVTVMAEEAGEAKVTVTGTARMESSSFMPEQTISNVASITFPVMVTDEMLMVTSLTAEPMEIDEGGMSTITATLNREVRAGDGEVMIGLVVVGDGTLDMESLTIAAGEMSGSAMLTAAEDDDYDDETVTVVASGSGITGTMQVEIAVADNDEAPVVPATVTEKSQEDVNAVFAAAVPANWTEGGADAMVDMSALFDTESTTVIYRSESSDDATVSTSDSGSMVTLKPVAAGSATITVTASDTESGDSAMASSMVAVAAIVLDPVMVMSVTAEPMEIDEGGMSTITATTNRAIDAATMLTLEVVGDEDAYMVPEMLEIPAGMTSGSVMLTASEDDDYMDESLAVIVTGPGIDGTMRVDITVTDNDEAPVTEPTVRAKDGAADMIAAAIATAAGDAPWMVGGMVATVDMSMLFEVDEGVTAAYSGTSSDDSVVSAMTTGGTMLALTPMSAGMATITVTGTDTAGGGTASVMHDATVALQTLMLTVTIDSMAIAEGGSATITAMANRNVTGDTMLSLTVTGDTAAVDAPDSLTIGSGTDMATAMVMAVEDDDSADANVSVVVSGSALASPVSFDIAITDNDPTVSALTQAEVDAVFTVAVATAGGADGWVPTSQGGEAATLDMGDLFDTNGSPTLEYMAESSAEDMVAVSASGAMLTLTPMAMGDATITVTATDTSGDMDDTATVMSSVMVGQTDLVVSVSPETASVEEGGSVEISAMLNRLAADNVEVMLVRDAASSASEDDYSLAPSAMITIMAGDASGMATLTATDDVMVEGEESVTLVARVKDMGDVGTVMVSIMDNDVVSSFMLSGPMDPNLVEGQSYELTVTADPAVQVDTEVTIMRDRAASDADDADFTVGSVMLSAGDDMGTTMLMVTDDGMDDSGHGMPEALVLYGMANGESTNSLTFNIWDAAVPALPIIAQLLLAAFLAIGGYRRYLRR